MSVFAGNRPLLDAFRRAERPALTAVYTFYVRDVAALIQRGFTVSEARVAVPGVRDPERQRDLLQEVFVRAFSEHARLAYDGLSPFRPWLMRIAKNLVIDDGRRSQRLAALEHSNAEQTLRDDDGLLPVSPEDELEWKTLQAATRAWRATCDAEMQRFVRLRFDEECSQSEVAEALGVTRRRVRTLEALARAGLRKYLVSNGSFPS